MLALPEEIKTHAMDGLGQLASVVLHQFEFCAVLNIKLIAFTDSSHSSR